MKDLIKRALFAPRGSMAQQAAITEIAEKFNEQSEQLALVSAIVLPEKEGEE